MDSFLTFNFFYSIQFWLWFIVILFLFRILSHYPYWRNVFLILASLLMLLALPRVNIFSLLFLLILSIIVFALGCNLNLKHKNQSKYRRILLSASGICLVIVILIFFKYNVIQRFVYENYYKQRFEPSNFIFIIGISYLSFKMIHFIIEGYKQQLSNVNLMNYLNYIFFFPSFISGPINRYNHFSAQLSKSCPSKVIIDCRIGARRIFDGLFKKIVICTLLYPYAFWGMEKSLSNLGWSRLALGLYATGFYHYLDFSAYSDIAIGSAKIMGLVLPENFNNPFSKRNLQQLWANWHISLTSWFTDYIYWPLSKKARVIPYFKKHPTTLSNIVIVITFIAVGMWHGESANFIMWGFYHGIGLAILNIYRAQKRKTKNLHLRQYFASKYSQAIGIFVTFHYFIIGLLFIALR